MQRSTTRRARAPIDSAAGKLFAGAVLAGCAVALLAGIYGKAHDPASETTVKWFFTSTLHLKAWFTTVGVGAGDPAGARRDVDVRQAR